VSIATAPLADRCGSPRWVFRRNDRKKSPFRARGCLGALEAPSRLSVSDVDQAIQQERRSY
jgi:hypothetical protein